METKFTKGEWKVAQLNNLVDAKNGEILHVVTNHENYYNEICTLYRNKDENKANAKLIAAAPDLLEACVNSFKTFISIGSTMESDIMIQLENAIKKAVGSVSF